MSRWRDVGRRTRILDESIGGEQIVKELVVLAGDQLH